MALSAALSGCSVVVLLSYALLVAVIVSSLRQARLWYRLRHIPGPRLASWSIWWQLRGALSGDLPQLLKAATDEYGAFWLYKYTTYLLPVEPCS